MLSNIFLLQFGIYFYYITLYISKSNFLSLSSIFYLNKTAFQPEIIKNAFEIGEKIRRENGVELCAKVVLDLSDAVE